MTASPADLYQQVRALVESVPESDLVHHADGAEGVGVHLDGSDGSSPARLHLRRTCLAAVRGLDIDGAGICLWSGEGGLVTAAASDERHARVEELQLVVGEGPGLRAFELRAPVLVPDLSETAAVSWTAYPGQAADLGVRAAFAFPLQLGGSRLGVLDVYRDQPGPLAPGSVPLALTFAEVVFLDLVQELTETGDAESLADSAAANRYEIYQAQGMVMVQLQVGAETALLRLRAHAFARGVPLLDLARDVVERRVSLEEHDDERP